MLIPLTFSHQCMSVFLLECSDFWSSRIVLQKDVIRKGGGVEDVGVGGMILTSSYRFNKQRKSEYVDGPFLYKTETKLLSKQSFLLVICNDDQTLFSCCSQIPRGTQA